jgi:hypothetical protein
VSRRARRQQHAFWAALYQRSYSYRQVSYLRYLYEMGVRPQPQPMTERERRAYG